MPADQLRAEPYVLGAKQSRRPLAFAGGEMWLRAGAPDTAGGATVVEVEFSRGGPSLHVHDRRDEMFFILSGTMIFQIDDETVEVGEGGFVWVPRGAPHAFANPSDKPVRALGIGLPGGMEDFFAEQAAYIGGLSGGAADPARLAELMEKHGGRIVGPPIRLEAL